MPSDGRTVASVDSAVFASMDFVSARLRSFLWGKVYGHPRGFDQLHHGQQQLPVAGQILGQARPVLVGNDGYDFFMAVPP